MANQLNNLPVFPTPLIENKATNKDWYFFFAGLFQGLAPEPESAVDLDASPAIFTAPRGGFLIIQGGTVSLVEWSRDGVTFYNTAQTQGIFPLSSTDQLQITYSVLPTAVTFVPT